MGRIRDFEEEITRLHHLVTQRDGSIAKLEVFIKQYCVDFDDVTDEELNYAWDQHTAAEKSRERLAKITKDEKDNELLTIKERENAAAVDDANLRDAKKRIDELEAKLASIDEWGLNTANRLAARDEFKQRIEELEAQLTAKGAELDSFESLVSVASRERDAATEHIADLEAAVCKLRDKAQRSDTWIDMNTRILVEFAAHNAQVAAIVDGVLPSAPSNELVGRG